MKQPTRRRRDAVQVEGPGPVDAQVPPQNGKAVGPAYKQKSVEEYALAGAPKDHRSAPGKTCPVVRITVPYPPTANNLYPTVMTRRGPRRVRSTELQRYHTVVANACRKQAVECFPKDVELEVTYFVYMPIKSDLDNRIKAVQDALKGHLWEDDRQIGVFHAHRFRAQDSLPDGRVIVEARPLVR